MTILHWVVRLAGGLVLIWSAGFLVFATQALEPAHEPGVGDGIVALTGGGARIEEALKLLAEHRGQRMLISGVNQHTSKAALAQQVPEHAALFACCIDIDNALDTVGNARETQAWAAKRGYKRLLIVTSGYHMARSLAEISQVFPEAQLIPHPVVPASLRSSAWWASRSTTRLLLVEYVKLWPALAKLTLSRLLPRPDSRPTSTAQQPTLTPARAAVN